MPNPLDNMLSGINGTLSELTNRIAGSLSRSTGVEADTVRQVLPVAAAVVGGGLVYWLSGTIANGWRWMRRQPVISSILSVVVGGLAAVGLYRAFHTSYGPDQGTGRGTGSTAVPREVVMEEHQFNTPHAEAGSTATLPRPREEYTAAPARSWPDILRLERADQFGGRDHFTTRDYARRGNITPATHAAREEFTTWEETMYMMDQYFAHYREDYTRMRREMLARGFSEQEVQILVPTPPQTPARVRMESNRLVEISTEEANRLHPDLEAFGRRVIGEGPHEVEVLRADRQANGTFQTRRVRESRTWDQLTVTQKIARIQNRIDSRLRDLAQQVAPGTSAVTAESLGLAHRNIDGDSLSAMLSMTGSSAVGTDTALAAGVGSRLGGRFAVWATAITASLGMANVVSRRYERLPEVQALRSAREALVAANQPDAQGRTRVNHEHLQNFDTALRNFLRNPLVSAEDRRLMQPLLEMSELSIINYRVQEYDQTVRQPNLLRLQAFVTQNGFAEFRDASGNVVSRYEGGQLPRYNQHFDMMRRNYAALEQGGAGVVVLQTLAAGNGRHAIEVRDMRNFDGTHQETALRARLITEVRNGKYFVIGIQTRGLDGQYSPAMVTLDTPLELPQNNLEWHGVLRQAMDQYYQARATGLQQARDNGGVMFVGRGMMDANDPSSKHLIVIRDFSDRNNPRLIVLRGRMQEGYRFAIEDFKVEAYSENLTDIWTRAKANQGWRSVAQSPLPNGNVLDLNVAMPADMLHALRVTPVTSASAPAPVTTPVAANQNNPQTPVTDANDPVMGLARMAVAGLTQRMPVASVTEVPAGGASLTPTIMNFLNNAMSQPAVAA